jgi:tRNA 2-thiouridine synthesizing protein A
VTLAERRYDALIDARGLSCPMPLVKARQALMVLGPGATVCVLATDPAARRDFEDFAETTGHRLVEARDGGGGVLWLVVEKRG